MGGRAVERPPLTDHSAERPGETCPCPAVATGYTGRQWTLKLFQFTVNMITVQIETMGLFINNYLDPDPSVPSLFSLPVTESLRV